MKPSKPNQLIIFLVAFNLFMLGLTFSHHKTIAFFSDQEKSTGNTLSAATSFLADLADLEDKVEEVKEAVEDALTGEDTGNLYDLMATDFQDEFPRDEFDAIIVTSAAEIDHVSIPYNLTTFGDDNEWAESYLDIQNSDGTTDTFLTVFVRDGREWRIFGTQLVE